MMNKFLKKQCLALILLMGALMAPIAFAQGQVCAQRPIASLRAGSRRPTKAVPGVAVHPH